MICSRCGTNVPEGSNVCPRCGTAMAYQQPQNYGQPAGGYGGYPQSVYAPPPAAYGRPKAAPKDGPLAFIPVFMFLVAVFASLGLFAMPIYKYEHQDTTLGATLSLFIRVGGKKVDCKFVKAMLIIGLVVVGITAVLAVITAVLAGKRNTRAALNVCLTALIINTIAYIVQFMLYFHINGDDHLDGEADMPAAIIVMILLCAGMSAISFIAARLAKRETNA